MIRQTDELREFERRQAREATRTVAQAMAVFRGLWEEAVLLNPGFPGEWRDDLEADLAIARALNGLSPGA